MNISKEHLTQLIQSAKEAHDEYEKTLGRPDENWPEWYAGFIIEQLKKHEREDT